MAVISAITSGLAAFTSKVSVQKGFNPEIFILHSTFVPAPLLFLGVFLFETDAFTLFVFLFGLTLGILASVSGVIKIVALEYIDTTIFFPIFKIVAPLIAIMLGALYFQEAFTFYEWLGLLLSLLVPLLLITKIEHTRQKDLIKGLLLILLAGGVAGFNAALYKYFGLQQAGFSGFSHFRPLALRVVRCSSLYFAIAVTMYGRKFVPVAHVPCLYLDSVGGCS